MWREARDRREAKRATAVAAAARRQRERDLEELVHGPIWAHLRTWLELRVRATLLPDGFVGLALRYGEEHGMGKLVLDQSGGGGLAPWPTGLELTADIADSSSFHVELVPGWLLVWAENHSRQDAVAEARRLVALAT